MHKYGARSGDIAKELGLSGATIQGYARAGLIPFQRTPGGQYRFNLEEVKAALDGGRTRLSNKPTVQGRKSRLGRGSFAPSSPADQLRRKVRRVVTSPIEEAPGEAPLAEGDALKQLVSHARRVLIAS